MKTTKPTWTRKHGEKNGWICHTCFVSVLNVHKLYQLVHAWKGNVFSSHWSDTYFTCHNEWSSTRIFQLQFVDFHCYIFISSCTKWCIHLILCVNIYKEVAVIPEHIHCIMCASSSDVFTLLLQLLLFELLKSLVSRTMMECWSFSPELFFPLFCYMYWKIMSSVVGRGQKSCSVSFLHYV